MSFWNTCILAYCRLGIAGFRPRAPGTAGSALAALLAPLLFLPLPLWGRLLFLAVIVVTGRSGRHPGRDPAGAHRPRGSGHRRARGRLDRPAAPGRGPVVVARSGLGLCPVPSVRYLEALARARLGKLAARRLGHHAGRYPGRSHGHVLHAGAAGPGLGLAKGERTSSHAAAAARGCLRRDGYGAGETAFSAGQREKKPLPFAPSYHSARLMREGEGKKAGPSQDGQGEAVLLEETKKGRCGVLFSYLLQGKGKTISPELPCLPGRGLCGCGKGR